MFCYSALLIKYTLFWPDSHLTGKQYLDTYNYTFHDINFMGQGHYFKTFVQFMAL